MSASGMAGSRISAVALSTLSMAMSEFTVRREFTKGGKYKHKINHQTRRRPVTLGWLMVDPA